MKIYLCAREDNLFNAWKLFCGQYEFVEVTKQDIMSINADSIVSPANSFGFMTGGIDLHYKNYFGQPVEDTIRQKIVSEYNGELCIGQATSIKIIDPKPLTKYKYVIFAPTMRIPENVSHTINAFLSAKAALIEANKINADSIVFPGLGTGTGGMLAEDCAKQVSAAIKYVLLEERCYKGVKDLYEEQGYMRSNIVTKKWFEVQCMEN